MKTEFYSKKQSLGLIYGVVAGLVFAALAWGVDALLLARAHTIFFWIKLVPGLIVSVLAGGIIGWLTIRLENHLLALFLWGAFAVLLAWLVIWLPTQGVVYITRLLNPDLAALYHYPKIADEYQLRIVSLMIVATVTILSGLLEINLIEQALFSSSIGTTVSIMFVCVVLLSAAGSATDHLINTNFREPIQAVDEMIQFAVDHTGEEIPKDLARSMHLSSLRNITDQLQKHRELTIIKYDPSLGMIDILVNFGGTLAKCTTIYSQTTDCILIQGDR